MCQWYSEKRQVPLRLHDWVPTENQWRIGLHRTVESTMQCYMFEFGQTMPRPTDLFHVVLKCNGAAASGITMMTGLVPS